MEEFTNQERSLFLRFVWGRTRLPRTIADFRGRDFVLQVSKMCRTCCLHLHHQCVFWPAQEPTLDYSHFIFCSTLKSFSPLIVCVHVITVNYLLHFLWSIIMCLLPLLCVCPPLLCVCPWVKTFKTAEHTFMKFDVVNLQKFVNPFQFGLKCSVDRHCTQWLAYISAYISSHNSANILSA